MIDHKTSIYQKREKNHLLHLGSASPANVPLVAPCADVIISS